MPLDLDPAYLAYLQESAAQHAATARYCRQRAQAEGGQPESMRAYYQSEAVREQELSAVQTAQVRLACGVAQ
jgi:hypothetical protein